MSTSAAIRKPDAGTLRRYNTPAVATQVLLNRVHIDGVVSEPMAGDGAISNVLRAHLQKQREFAEDAVPERGLWTNDLDTTVDADYHLDACRPDSWPKISNGRRPDWIVTNPEFSIAYRSVPLALATALLGIAMLLRITWLEPTEEQQPRGEFLSLYPPSHLIVLPRLSFKTVIRKSQGKTKTSNSDSATCAWYVWYKFGAALEDSYRRNQKIEIVRKREMAELMKSGAQHLLTAGRTETIVVEPERSLFS